MEEKKRNENEIGITLVALVITVILMLILAGVAISVLTSDGGLFEKTQGTADKYEQAAQNEADQIASLMNEIDDYLNGVPTPSTPQEPDTPEEPETLVVKLADGMVPVVYNTSDTSWYVATQEQMDNKSWYDYIDTSVLGQASKSQWANVMLRDNLKVNGIANAKTATLEEMYGKKVTSEGSMFVYIPRFAYQITSNLHNGGEAIVGDIDVVFINTNNKNGYVTYNTTYPATTDAGTGAGKMNDFVVHPAFTWAKEDGTAVALEGIWIGKFEASSANASYTATEAGNVTTSNSVILRTVGNVSSWRSINRNNIFLNCYNMNNSTNASIYGISTNKDIIDPHLIKNTEWGAAAYLAHSKYGRNKIADESMSNLTGYNTGNGNYKANVALSTTNNVYGIYDMSGGAWEHVAAYVDSTKGGTVENQYLAGENFGKALYDAKEKYKDVYVAAITDDNVNNYNANSNKFGDGVYETSIRSYDGGNYLNSSWNEDRSHFPFSSVPFFYRGCYYSDGVAAGVFAFGNSTGTFNTLYGFRAALAIP